MRKITKDAVEAFNNNFNFKRDNTQVVANAGLTVLVLHGNVIATKSPDTGGVCVSNGGWFSNTTKERLNGLDGVSINQRKGEWYLNGEKWDGSVTKIK